MSLVQGAVRGCRVGCVHAVDLVSSHGIDESPVMVCTPLEPVLVCLGRVVACGAVECVADRVLAWHHTLIRAG